MGLFNSIRLGSSAAGDYEVERSLRFNDDDTAYLERTPSSDGNKRTWTFSTWIKRSKLTSLQTFFSAGSNNPDVIIKFTPTDQFEISRYGGSYTNQVTSTQLFRDPSAWYHLVAAVDTTQSTASDRVKMYVNGTQITEFANSSYPSQDYEYPEINDTGFSNKVGKHGSNSQNFDGYMSEVHFIDGLQLTPSSFGKTNPVTGQWIPKKYGGSYGTNGFYLNFSDNSGTTATTLGKDYSGNGNNFTPYNLSVSAGQGNDSLEDTPTNNFCTIDPLSGRGGNYLTNANGNLDFTITASTTYPKPVSSFQIPTSGKWYSEWVFTTVGTGVVGVGNVNTAETAGAATQANGINYLYFGEIRINDGYTQASLTAFGANDIVGIKVDRDAGTVAFTINGSAAGNAENISSMNTPHDLVFWAYRNSSGGSDPVGFVNFGQRPFSNLPTGYKGLCSANLADPTINLPTDHFNTVLYSGDGNATKSITGVGFQPDWLWLKGRNTSYSNLLYNSVVGAGTAKGLNSNESRAEGATVGDDATYGYLNSFDSDGFSVTKGSDSTSYTNGGSSNYVAWNWKAGGSASSNGDGSITSSVSANTTAGFSIVSYTGTGSDATIGHGLGVAPKVVIVKCRDGVHSWRVYFSGITDTDGKYLALDSNISTASGSDKWNGAPTSSVFGVSGDNSTGGSLDYIAYCFSEVAGYSKAGTYLGTGNANGPMVYLGFKPAWILYKATNDGQGWQIHDTNRIGYNDSNYALRPDSGTAEATNVNIDILSNGFKLRNGLAISNGGSVNYAYFAIAESPFKYSRAR